MIAIADYGMGNIRSVQKAFEHAQANAIVTHSPDEILKSDALVVPGVGAFGDCIKNLDKLKLIETIKKFISSGRPYLGICLGMQILFESSEEAPWIPGLCIFRGTIKKFPESAGLKIPHMGWNVIKIKRPVKTGAPKSKIKNTLLENIPNESYFYFVHSYYAEPEDKSIIAAETEYGIKFCSMLWKDNIWATQFHPEKSQNLGLQIIKNFIGLCK